MRHLRPQNLHIKLAGHLPRPACAPAARRAARPAQTGISPLGRHPRTYMAEEWSEADLFESDQAPEPEPEPADAPEVAAAEGLALRTPSRASLLSDITAVNSPTVTARCEAVYEPWPALAAPGCEPAPPAGRRLSAHTNGRPSEDGKACKKRAFAPEELVFSLDGEEEGDGEAEPAEEQPPVKLQHADGGAALAWQRGGFLPPHAWCQSLPANAPSTEAPFLPVRACAVPVKEPCPMSHGNTKGGVAGWPGELCSVACCAAPLLCCTTVRASLRNRLAGG